MDTAAKVAALLVIPFLVSLAAAEFHQRGGPVGRALVRIASLVVPRSHRYRYREEWLAELEYLEPGLAPIMMAIRILVRAPLTSSALVRDSSSRDSGSEIYGRIVGPVRVGVRTKDLIPSVKPGEILFINQPDISRAIATALVDARVAAIVNASES